VAKASRPYPKGVWFQPKRLTTGELAHYGYYGRGSGTVALGRRGTPEFFSKLADVVSREPASENVTRLIWAYRKKALPLLRDRTQSDYRPRLDKIELKFGSLSLRAMGSDTMARHILAWRDEMAGSPRQADYLIQVLSALLGWGVRERMLAKNQAAQIRHLYRGDRRDSIWTTEQEDAFLSSAPEPLQRALIVAIETGQRQADLLRLPWSAVVDNHIALRQAKTKVDVAIPISRRLRACLDAAPKGTSTTILTTERDLPWEPKGNGFRSAWRAACAQAGVSGVTFHDLRGTFATRRLSEGWTTEDVALCTGHSLRDLASLERYVSRAGVAAKRAEAMAKRMAQSGS